ncbi:uncharacterized protein ACA1_193460 [Acanthamoeba castellanii str. Neff]|uniref:Uncharacterized protein n=1 Tax=Acanthamoeba castellanii (strain ATCC 30010 / Neff) TaxID=1257118 RepID=L8GPH4_ACACF|nr:uncharacterized protein ACA1_193460 [Acanthamoeba castellanii str. Neff]ELR14533.1 hypothetical protein ACA1_193460 [Acanthamoeba castellanii str. Neff]
MVKQLEWKKQKESNLKKKSLSELQNMCTVDVTAQTRPAREEQVILPTAMATDEELLKLLKERHVQFLSKVRKVATLLMDRDFIHLKNKVATGEWDHHITCDQEQLLLILSNPHINIEDIIPELQERIQEEKEKKEKAEEKEKCK